MKLYTGKAAAYKELILLLVLLLAVTFPFQLSCASVFVSISRLSLMFIINLVTVTMSSVSIMHFIDTQPRSGHFRKFTGMERIMKKRCGLSKWCNVGIAGTVITQIFCRTGVEAEWGFHYQLNN